jgi:hypothetical protein
MRRNRKTISTSEDMITNLAEITKMNFDMLTKLLPWLAANEQTQLRFRIAVINSFARIEAALSLLVVGQEAQMQGKRAYFYQEKLEEDAKAADKFISEQAVKRGQSVMRYIYSETEPTHAMHDRRRKWSNWEI